MLNTYCINQNTENSLLKNLVYHFYNGNLNFCFKPEDVEEMHWKWQQTFLDATVNSQLIKQYPISSKFIEKFLKKIIEYLQPNQEIHDDLYSMLCTTMSVSSQNVFYYRHYIIGKCLNNVITIKETRNMVVNGTTGLKTWEAALILSDWALSNKDVFSNKTVLELGSGVGFAGITIGKMCDIKSLCFTDCHNEVLKMINENITINFAQFEKEETGNMTTYKNEIKSLGVMMLDWNDIDNIRVSNNPDIIIGADIVYDPTLIQPLCNVLQKFCTKKNIEIYIASIIRNKETFSVFLNTLDAMNFHWEKMEICNSVLIEWDASIDKCLLKITSQL